ncbi:MAG: GMC family oxidoreductase [Okeania sp. SIO2D1]|nr:GMC family oxidoreductase [Okeania sp. SIO2D1]
MQEKYYDLIIIGAGAGGGTLAYALASSGKRILILEQGNYLPKEQENWEPGAIFLEERYQTDEKWLDKNAKPFSPETHYFVGGNTKVYGATLQRMRVRDFQEVKHYEGTSPSWELSYEDYQPYYTEAEKLYKIHGMRGEDPTEPPATEPYPFPPLPHEPRIEEISDGLKAVGLQPFHLTLALDRDVENPQNSKCIRCNTCDPYPCLIDAKCDAQVACVDKALQYKNVTLKVNTRVTRLLPNEAGNKVEKIEAEVNGKREFFTAEIVVVSCGAINSAKLLLQSANEQYPQGLANSSGLVGRNLMLHNHSAIIAVSPQQNNTSFQKTLGFNDFYFSGKDNNYPLGSIQLTGKAKWQRLKSFAPSFVPNFVLKYMADHSVDFWVTTEDLPRPENRIYLNSQGELVVDYSENNLQPHQELISLVKYYLRKQGFYFFWSKKMPLKVIWHQIGTCKFGSNPQKSVLDLNCCTHDLDNLYVVDASFMPSMGAMNPTLTIIANSLRVADHLKKRLADTVHGSQMTCA